ncbi:MAG: hypothetical protein ABSD62_15470, partial [Candidatus Limnocylindrales bacterium]
TSSATVTIAIGTNPGGGTLSGTTSVAAVAGVATFSNLSINLPGTGYTLSATSTGLTSATSSAFDIILPPLSITLYKQICASYGDVPANDAYDNLDATGGHAGELNRAHQTAITDPNVDLVCASYAGWSFNFYHSQSDANNGNVARTVTTAGAGGSITVSLDQADVIRARYGGGVWIDEALAPTVAGFGSIRCWTDILNGDNLENVQYVPNDVPQVYCIAYNVNTPALTLTKTADPGSTFSKVNDQINYTYTVKNTGPVTLSGPFTVSDTKIGTVNCGTGLLVQNATIQCTASYWVTQTDLDAGSVTNTATGYGHFGPTVVGSDPVTVVVTGVQTKTLSLTKTISGGDPFLKGGTITYGYTIKNTGNVTLTGPDLHSAPRRRSLARRDDDLQRELHRDPGRRRRGLGDQQGHRVRRRGDLQRGHRHRLRQPAAGPDPDQDRKPDHLYQGRRRHRLHVRSDQLGQRDADGPVHHLGSDRGRDLPRLAEQPRPR